MVGGRSVGKLKGGDVPELLLPKRELLLQLLPLKPLPLPDRKVRILDGQLRKGDGFPCEKASYNAESSR